MPNSWIYKINESNSRNHKEDAIRQALEAAMLGAKDAHEFLTLARNAYNPYVTFNNKQIPVTKGIKGQKNDISAFCDFLHRLAQREVTGNAALIEIEMQSLRYDSDLWNDLLRPTILKDLRCGATIKTFNKMLVGTAYEIPVFECQLATDSNKHTKHLKGKKRLEQKLDGVRALAVVDRHFSDKVTVTICSRNGKPLDNFPHIEKQIAEVLKVNAKGGVWASKKYKQFVLDGEIVSENFQALMKQTQRKTNVDTSDAVYVIFDVIPLPEFQYGKWNVKQSERTYKWLEELRGPVNDTCPSLHVIDGIEVDLDTQEGHDIMRRFAQDQVDMGYEGIMIKDLKAPYECKRGRTWMKWKPTITVDLTVVGMEEGTGKFTGTLGNLLCEGTEDGKFIKVSVGGGLTDKQRDDFWKNPTEVLQMIVEVKADAITKSQDGDYYSLRFPRFERFRGMVADEKI